MWEFWLGSIKPALIPESEIIANANALILQHQNRATEIASIEEDRAWRYGQTFERGKWRRIKRYILNESAD